MSVSYISASKLLDELAQTLQSYTSILTHSNNPEHWLTYLLDDRGRIVCTMDPRFATNVATWTSNIAFQIVQYKYNRDIWDGRLTVCL